MKPNFQIFIAVFPFLTFRFWVKSVHSQNDLSWDLDSELYSHGALPKIYVYDIILSCVIYMISYVITFRLR